MSRISVTLQKEFGIFFFQNLHATFWPLVHNAPLPANKHSEEVLTLNLLILCSLNHQTILMFGHTHHYCLLFVRKM